ncbi:hypothetical protein AUJ66_07295 [Candidatus Desantisbacteria bacterium CG1_02_38_46]|uniref:Amidohydrolase-related domain-containing protein n=2 Tax=unclassified Candidatus Desantisiibacteriota TaxID=3106372 RepID=A0A2H9PBH0_9BACT|nr:MAG: hypothetical protein AUJ66_07295 [Candidatus Desantisbacteria bacterium CG1_02_38_46]PIZ16154.1 MAG: hypothetical protein COY51_03375 [Candidatus Desantisbacteria bacterium CG_4_10_14_0_8_um_filter_39_17]
MKVNFFDVNICFGKSRKGIYKPADSVSELLSKLNSAGIEKALVWHISQYENSPVKENAVLSQMISPYPGLLGTWVILPPQTKELPVQKEFFSRMKKDRIFALRAFPDFHRFLLNRVTFGKFLEEIEERRIPLLLSMDIMGAGISWQTVYDILEEFPRLVLILCDLPVWGSDRYFRPLIEKYPNFYLETSFLLQSGVLESFVRDYGAGKLLFGSGFPYRDFGGPMLYLLHADISNEDKIAIAGSNLSRIISEVKL